MANQYYYLDSANQQHGPIAAETLKSHGVHEKSLVWCVGMTSWTPANQVPELQVYFPQTPTPPSQPSPYHSSQYQQPQPQPQPQRSPAPDSNMVWAILTTLLCCMPLGIIAIVKASQVESLWHQGFHKEAINAANSAKKWSITGALCGLFIIVAYFLFYFCLFASMGGF